MDTLAQPGKDFTKPCTQCQQNIQTVLKMPPTAAATHPYHQVEYINSKSGAKGQKKFGVNPCASCSRELLRILMETSRKFVQEAIKADKSLIDVAQFATLPLSFAGKNFNHEAFLASKGDTFIYEVTPEGNVLLRVTICDGGAVFSSWNASTVVRQTFSALEGSWQEGSGLGKCGMMKTFEVACQLGFPLPLY